jgi:hypothetical protein
MHPLDQLKDDDDLDFGVRHANRHLDIEHAIRADARAYFQAIHRRLLSARALYALRQRSVKRMDFIV